MFRRAFARALPVLRGPAKPTLPWARMSRGFAVVGAGLAAGGTWEWTQAAAERNVYTWGSSQYGQLGHGDERSEQMPRLVEALKGLGDVVVVCAGGADTLAITAKGEVYTWGKGQEKALGHGDMSNVSYPKLVEDLADVKIVTGAMSETHSAVVDENGQVYTWGKNALGYKGDGLEPEKVQGLAGVKVKHVTCGKDHTLAVTEDGKLYAWGNGYNGALGMGGRDNFLEPSLVPAFEGKPVKMTAAGNGFSLVLTEGGQVFAFGIGDYGQTGMGSTDDRYMRTPTLIRSLKRKKIASVAAGEYHAACCTVDGSMYTWGLGSDGQIGIGSKELFNTSPSLNLELKSEKIVKVACGGGHTAAVNDQGRLFIWGRGRDGQIGRADKTESVAAYRSTPIEVTFFRDVGPVSEVSLGSDFSTALC